MFTPSFSRNARTHSQSTGSFIGVTRGFMGGVEVGAATSIIMGSGTGISAYSDEGANTAAGAAATPITATITGIANSACVAKANRS